jgi:thioredoxin-related protein
VSKKIKILLMGVFFIGMIILAVTFGIAAETLPVGSNLPYIKYTNFVDTNFITVKSKPIMIMYFKPACPYCEYELKIMNKGINGLGSADIYLITTEKSFFQDSVYKKQINLISAENVKFGLVAEDEYKEKFGITATPAFYFFDHEGKLVEKIIGETKFDRLIESIKKAGGAQHQWSGLN